MRGAVGMAKTKGTAKVISTYPDAELLARIEAAAKADHDRPIGPMVLILVREALDARKGRAS